jgi:Mg/Co/Ni transporter MgtE
MLNRKEMLINILGEEGAEAAQAASKIIRFGEYDQNPATGLTNRQQLRIEVIDFMTLVNMTGIMANMTPDHITELMKKKEKKVEHYLLRSIENGCMKQY